ncbi:hypothetical protein H1V43_18440 [Streptomyces sp. PSKA54]|uniref:Lyase n=1 Tax=Streptomyces himalayensis subsp. aureolus TaxID=2758039 RepID=A0A7W2HGT8_9ACTN|nr:hypothetical protein [Streptomyces himalayensis subsp. aureolus]
MDAFPASPLSRRRLLAYGAAATGAVSLPFLPAVTPAAQAAESPALTELEERALALQPPAFLLESAVPPQITADAGGSLSISDAHSVCGQHAMRWDHGAGSVITVASDLAWAPDPYDPKPLADQAWQGTVDTFSVWIHNETAVDDVVRFEFGRGSRTDCWFEFRLDFTGWRTAWVRYAYDMHGRPRAGMDTVRIIAPRRPGTLWIDQLLLNVALRPDTPTRDAQVPEVCVEGDDWDQSHWQALYLFDRVLTRTQIETPDPSTAELDAFQALLTRYHDDYLAAAPKVDDAYVTSLTGQADTLLTGRPVFSYQSQIYPPEISTDLKTFVNAATLRAVTDQMQKVAQAYDVATAAHRPALGALYVRFVRRLREQGWTYGSCQGTIHHLGYDIRGYYDSVFLMRDVLRGAGLLKAVRADLTWLTGFGRIFRGFDHRNAHGSTADILNTTVRGMLAVALLQDGEARQIAYLKALRDWLSAYLLPTDGIQDGLKTDGTTFHHVGFFPDYARDGFTGLAPIVYVMSGGLFRISPEAHETLKRAVLTLRVVANTTQWPIALSGRNPAGTTGLTITPFQWLAIAGTPDGSQDLSPRTQRGLPAPAARGTHDRPEEDRRTTGGRRHHRGARPVRRLGVQLRGPRGAAARRLAGHRPRPQPLPVVHRDLRRLQLVRPLQHLRPDPGAAPRRPRHQPRQRLQPRRLRLEPPPRDHHPPQAVDRAEGRPHRHHRGDAADRGGVRGGAHHRRPQRHVRDAAARTPQVRRHAPGPQVRLPLR